MNTSDKESSNIIALHGPQTVIVCLFANNEQRKKNKRILTKKGKTIFPPFHFILWFPRVWVDKLIVWYEAEVVFRDVA